MVENKVKALLENATDIIVLDKAYPDVFPCITFHFYGESGALFGSGTATEETMLCQIDIWYKTKNDFIKAEIKKVKDTIKNQKYFAFPKKETVFETTTKIYHTHLNFELLESEE